MRQKMPIFYSALMLTAVNLLLRFAGTSFQVYISSRIGPAGVGLLQLVMSVGMLAMVAGMAGVRTASMYLSAEELGRKCPENVAWVLSGCFVYSILCSGAVAAALYSLAPYLAEHWIGDIRTLEAIRLYAAFLPVSCLCGVMTGFFTAANRIGILAAVEVAEQAISMTLTIWILHFWAGSDPTRACQAIIIGSGTGGCLTLCALCLLRLRSRPATSPRIPVRRRLLQCAVPLAIGDIARTGISTTENLMVPKRLALYHGTTTPLAAFGLISGMVFPVLMFPAAILFGLAELLIPELARCAAAGSTERIRYLVRRSLRTATIYGLIFCVLMVHLACPLCLRLYGNEEAADQLRRYALMIPMLYCDAITDAMTKGLGQQKACVRYNIFTSAMDVALLFWLLPRHGMDGYYISFLVTHGINFMLSLRRLLQISQVKISVLKPTAAIGATALTLVVTRGIAAPFPAVCASLAVLGCLLFLLGVLRREDIRRIESLIKNK